MRAEDIVMLDSLSRLEERKEHNMAERLSRPLKVYDLYEYCRACMREGFADYEVYIADDEECNGYHPLYWGFEVDENEIERLKSCGVRGIDGAEDIALLG